MGQSGKENGVDVEYTGGTVLHLDDSLKYGYDAKIEQKEGGSTNFYASSDGWQSHSHDVYDGDEHTYGRDVSEKTEDHSMGR